MKIIPHHISTPYSSTPHHIPPPFYHTTPPGECSARDVCKRWMSNFGELSFMSFNTTLTSAHPVNEAGVVLFVIVWFCVVVITSCCYYVVFMCCHYELLLLCCFYVLLLCLLCISLAYCPQNLLFKIVILCVFL